MLTYNLSDGNGPLYYRLYQCIRDDIAHGSLEPNTKLPSKRELAAHLGVGVNTVIAAYDQLLSEGFIYASERRGYYVEELSGYRPRDDSHLMKADEPPEVQFLADFKANRTGSSLFPASTWRHCMREALSVDGDELSRVVPYNGLYELRRAIADYLRRCRGIDVSPAQVIVGAGTEYLYNRLLQLFGHATTFAIEDPGYKKIAHISDAYNNPWRHIPIDSCGLIIDALEESGADVVHLSPANHFPTGIVMPIPRRIQLFEWANRVGKRYIIEDDYDSEFRYSGTYILPLFAEDTQGKVVYLNNFSKTIAPSIRVSYMLLPPALIPRYAETSSFYSNTVSSCVQRALAIFIDEGHLERHVNRLRKHYRQLRASVLSELNDSPLSAISTIDERNAGTQFLLRVHTDLPAKEMRARARERLLNLSLLSDYSFEVPNDEGHVLVINYAGLNSGLVKEVIAALASVFPECS